MQDPATGRLHQIEKEMAEALDAARTTEDAGSPAIWPTFREGEVVDVKGGKFRISHIGKRKIILRGVPADTEIG